MAVGHDPQSVWPGVDGAAVFLAHDVSYFVHLNAAQAGRRDHLPDRLQHGAVPGQRRTRSSPPARRWRTRTDPSLVLDTCWPPNALFFTPDRLLVRATEVGAATKGGNLHAGAQFVKTVAVHRLHDLGAAGRCRRRG